MQGAQSYKKNEIHSEEKDIKYIFSWPWQAEQIQITLKFAQINRI